MVLVSSFSAMQNSRPRVADIHHRNIPNGFEENPASRDTEGNCGSTLHASQHHHRSQGHKPQHQYSLHNDSRMMLRSSCLDHFTPPPGGTPTQHQQQQEQQQHLFSPSSSSSLASSSSPPTKSKTVVNGFIMDGRQTESSQRPRRSGHHKNGYSFDHRLGHNSFDDSNQNRPPYGPEAQSCTSLNTMQILPSHYSTSSLIDAGEHNARHKDSNSQFAPSSHHNFVKVDSQQRLVKSGHTQRSKPNGFARGNSFPVNGTSKPSVTSMSFDSAGSSMTNLDTWSPSYVKLNFFTSKGDSDPIHNPVPRGSSDISWKSESFTNSPDFSNNDNESIYSNSSNALKNSKSGYAMQLSSQSYPNMSRARQSSESSISESLVAEYTTLRSMSTARHSGRSSATTGSPEAANSMYATLPRRGSSDHYLRRTVSHEPKVQAIRPIIVKTPSDGEIESEYVTLDSRYVPQNTRLCRVAEGVVVHSDSSLPQPSPSSSNCGSFKDTENFITNPIATNSEPISVPSSLVKPNKSMLKTNNSTFQDSKRQTLKKKNSTGTLRTVAETLGSVFSSSKSSGGSSRGSGSPRSLGSIRGTTPTFEHSFNNSNTSVRRSSNGNQSLQHQKMTRSKSLPDLQADTVDDDESAKNYSDDEDGDDFGFLSYPISFSSSSSSAAMNKAKSPSPGNRIIPKRWRSKTKAVPSVSSAAMWTPGPAGSCTWSSVSGRKVHLRPVSILSLTEAERLALQKIALSKLQAMDIGCPVSIPKESPELRRTKKSSLSLKRRSKSVSASALDTMGKDGGALGLVFGLPLMKCLMNDRELEKKRRRMAAAAGSPSSMKMRTDSSENLVSARSNRKSSSSSQGSLDNNSGMASHQHDILTVPSHKRAASSDSLSESESSRNTSSSLIDALSLSTSNPASRLCSLAMDSSHLANHGIAQVPYVVKACFRHIESHGLQTLGIFRVGCSKKRVKQLREEFDSGKEVQLTEEHHPHDVGALLKEYFRDLPEPLFTRELYLPFLHAERMKDEHKKHTAVSLLISMLPVANRDTLWALLRFLATVSQHAPDQTDEKGNTIPGNKMDAHNLATLFGPNILHRTKAASDKELMSESAERVEQSKEVIEVVKDMIDNHHELFEIPGSLRDDILRLLIESDQETADKILKHLANQNQIEIDPESMSSVFEDSTNSPMLYHYMNSDADLLAYARRQTTTSHRPLRVTKSADNSLDSPIPKSRATHFSESQAFSPTSKDNQNAVPLNPMTSAQPRFSLGHSFPSPVPTRVPVLRVSHDPTSPEVLLRVRSEASNLERPYSEGYSQSLNIPRPLYLRENSSSSISSGLSSSLNSHGGSDNGHSGHWILPTPPASRGSSPKPFFRSASSSSTLIASPSPSGLNNSRSQDDFENNPPVGSAEWERERWKHWEKIAAQKKNAEAEQETLV